MKQLMNVIIPWRCNTKQEVLDKEVTTYKLINIDLLKKDICVPLNSLNLGTATKLGL